LKDSSHGILIGPGAGVGEATRKNARHPGNPSGYLIDRCHFFVKEDPFL